MENVFSLDDFLTEDRILSKVVDIDGVGKVKIFQISSFLSGQLQKAAKKHIADGDMSSEASFVAYGAYLFLSGGVEPSDEELERLMKRSSNDVLLKIYECGLSFNFTGHGHREDIEKNS